MSDIGDNDDPNNQSFRDGNMSFISGITKMDGGGFDSQRFSKQPVPMHQSIEDIGDTKNDLLHTQFFKKKNSTNINEELPTRSNGIRVAMPGRGIGLDFGGKLAQKNLDDDDIHLLAATS